MSRQAQSTVEELASPPRRRENRARNCFLLALGIVIVFVCAVLYRDPLLFRAFVFVVFGLLIIVLLVRMFHNIAVWRASEAKIKQVLWEEQQEHRRRYPTAHNTRERDSEINVRYVTSEAEAERKYV